MKKTLKLLTIMALVVCVLCGCGAKGNSGPVITLDEEDQALLDTLASDIQVVAPADFAAAVSGFNAESAGKVYQLTGYFYAAAEGAENPTLGDAQSKAKTAIEVRYLTQELTAGDQYTVTGIVTLEEHDGHAHITLDALTVETYVSE